MLQSITWLILIKLKRNHSNRKKKRSWKESPGGCVGVSDCSVSKVLSCTITRRATKEDLQQKTYHHRNCTCELHPTIPWTVKIDLYQETIKNYNKIWLPCPTMHCFTTAPFRKLVFQKGTEPSCTSSTLLVKGKGIQDLMAPSSQHLPFLRYHPLFSSNSVDFLIFLSDRNGKKRPSDVELLWGEQFLFRF